MHTPKFHKEELWLALRPGADSKCFGCGFGARRKKQRDQEGKTKSAIQEI